MQRSSSPTRRLRACASCSQARARCHFQPGSNTGRHVCDRCDTLGLACLAKASAGLRRPRRVKGGGGGVLGERPQEAMVEPAVTVPLPESSLPWRGIDHHPSQPQLPSWPASPPVAATPTTPSSTQSHQPPYNLTWPQADQALTIFHTDLVPLFPFVVPSPPPDESAHPSARLYAEKPLLFRAVMLVAAPFLSPGRIDAVKRDVLARVGQRLLVDDRRSLEVLQTLLICIAWADVRTLCDRQITNLTYLALGCAHTLGITRPPPSVLRQLGRPKAPNDLLGDVESTKKGGEATPDEHSLEEQRTFLGLYFLLTVNSTQFGRPNPLNALYVPHCTNRLRWSLQHPTDLLLDRLLRLAQLGDQIHHAYGPSTGSANSNGTHRDLGPQPAPAPLVEGQVGGIVPALESILESMEEDGDDDAGTQGSGVMFKLHYYYLLVRLYEPATLPLADMTSATHRSHHLHECLHAVKAYLDLLVTIPSSSSFLHQAISVATQTTFVTIMATRLTLLDLELSSTTTGSASAAASTSPPDWDVEHARRTLDFANLADRIANVVDEAEEARQARARKFEAETDTSLDSPAEAGHSTVESRLVTWAQGTRLIRDWYQAKIRGDTPPTLPGYGEDGSNISTELMGFGNASEMGTGPL